MPRRGFRPELPALGLTARLVLGLWGVTLLTMVAILLTISTVMRDRMYRTTDAMLSQQAQTLQALLHRSEADLIAEARTTSSLEGMNAALANRNGVEIKRLLIPVLVTHEVDSMYVIDARRQVLLFLGRWIGNPTQLQDLPVIQRGFDDAPGGDWFEMDNALWLVAAAPHRLADGSIDAVILLGKKLDQEYLSSIHQELGSQIVLVRGSSVVYSFDPAPTELPSEHLRASQDEIAEYRNAAGAYHSMDIAGVPYRAGAFDLSSPDGGNFSAYLFTPTTQARAAMWQAVAQVIAIGLVILALGSLLAYLYARSVTRPLTQLQRAARAIVGGDFDQSLPVKSRDEVGGLAGAFENMRTRVKTMLQAQQEWNANLEERVRAQTAELRRVSEIRDQLLRQTLTAQEEGRRRVARELHDETSQSLTALVANLAAAERMTPEQAQAGLGDLKTATVRILQDVNQIVLDLRPTLLDDYGLIAALTWCAKHRLETEGVQVDVSSFGAEVRLPPAAETTLFRIGQEAITNVAKHARASHVQISLLFANDESNETITLQIEDDGCGFDQNRTIDRQPNVRPALGLLGMRERIELVGGELEIRSEPGKGACITATVPLKHADETNQSGDAP